MPSKGDVEFTSLAVKEKLATRERVEECLKYQEEIEKEGRQTTVDRIMLQKGYLSEAQVFELNKKQGRRVVFCIKCAMKMNVAGLAVGQKIKCPKCQTSNVTPEKIAFELVEKSKPIGEPAPVAAPPPAPPPAPGTSAGKPPTVRLEMKEAPATVRMALSAGQKQELGLQEPNFIPPPVPAGAGGAPGEEKGSDAPKISDIRAEGKGKKFAMRRYGKR
ncbi:MAG: hypothetical protein AAB074_14900 [Planctomycetota bacterium]